MIEIMEPTDFAVRIEFERGGYILPVESRFMNRGIDFELSMFNYEPISVEHIKERFFCKPHVLETRQRSTEYVLIDEHNTPCFSVNRIDLRDSFVKASKTFYIGIVTKGSVATKHIRSVKAQNSLSLIRLVQSLINRKAVWKLLQRFRPNNRLTEIDNNVSDS